MSKTHTPTPWAAVVTLRADDEWNGGSQSVEISAGDVLIAKYLTDYVEYPSDEENEANAAFIVRACNSHHDLLAALKNVLDEYQGVIDPDRNGRHGFEEYAEVVAARAAIQKAEA